MYLTTVPSLLQTIFPSAIWSSANQPHLKLTFDDGPHPESTPQLLASLKAKQLEATFFCLGEQLERYPDLHQAMLEEGHTVGNHGYKHLSGWTTDYDTYINNVEQGARASSSTLYRPPYGRMTPRQYHHIKTQHRIVIWTSMPGDFDFKISKEKVRTEVEKAYKENGIIVLHDNPSSLQKVLYALEGLDQQQAIYEIQ